MIAFLITCWSNRKSRHHYIKREADESLSFCKQVIPVLATDWKLFTYCGIDEKKAKHLSLSLCYQQIAQQALFMGLERYVVIEDDLKVLDKSALWESVENLPETFDVVYLTRTKHNAECAVTVPHNRHFDLIKDNWWETPITVWSSSFARRFNEHLMEKVQEGIWTGNIDHILVQLNHGRHYGAKTTTAVGLSTDRKHAPPTISFETAIS